MKKTLKHLIPAGHIYMRDNVLAKDNLAGANEDKSAWANQLNLPHKAEYTFFAGCGYQFMKYTETMLEAARGMESVGIKLDKVMGLNRALKKVGLNLADAAAKIMTDPKEDHYTKVLHSAVSVLQKLGVDLGYLHQDEPCCGSPMYYAGFKEDYLKNAARNFGIFRSFGVKKIIGLIPACTAALKYAYPALVKDYDLKVWHFFEIVAAKLKEADLKPMLSEKTVITYHDPCQLARYLNIVDEPREIIGRIANLELVEPLPEKSREWTTCCGGGGLEASNQKLAERLGSNRADELLATGASIIVTSCPACLKQLRQSLKKKNPQVKVMDLIELIDQALLNAPEQSPKR